MPIYTYHCDGCGLQEDKVLPMGHDIPVHCKRYMRKVFTPVSFHSIESTRDKVTGGLSEATWMKPEYQKMAMSGFDRKKTIF